MSALITILSDAGHGGKDSGAVHPTRGTKEKDVVLSVSLKFGRYVEQLSGGRIRVIQSRDDDRFLTLSERRRKADKLGAKLISWHCNAAKGTGFEAFTYPGESGSDKWATALLEAFDEAKTGIDTLRADWGDGDPDKEARFTVLGTNDDAVLFELGFIDRNQDERVLKTESFQDMAAKVLATATCKHFGMLSSSSEPIAQASPAPASPSSEVLKELEDLRAAMKAIKWQVEKLAKSA